MQSLLAGLPVSIAYARTARGYLLRIRMYSKKVVHVYTHHLRPVAIDYEYIMLPYGNGNIGLHVCAKFHDHTQ